MRSVIVVSVLVLTAILSAAPALASGTSGGGYRGDIGAFPSPPLYDPAAEAYSRGKAMVSRRITCKKCAYPEGVKDMPTAQKVAASVRAGEFALKPADREQVLYYLSRRFGT